MIDSTNTVPAPPPPATDASVEREAHQATALRLAELVVERSRGVTLYRCSTCGKWSHAKRQPKSHQLFIRAEDVSLEWPDWKVGNLTNGSRRIVRVVEGYSNEYGSDDGGVFIECGPFEAWKAVRDV